MGLGVSGLVYLYKDKNLAYVVKKHNGRENYETRREYKKRVLREYDLLQEISHEYFIKAIKYQVSFDGNTISIHLEAGDRNLGELLKALPGPIKAEEALCLWKQICVGVEYLHQKGYSHRDLKLENVVLSRNSNTIKIIDLVTASPTNKPAFGLVGSLHYSAPEQFTQLSYEGKAADMWSLGIILYVLVFKKFPWPLAQVSDSVYLQYLNEQSALEEGSGAPHLENSIHRFTSLSEKIGNASISGLLEIQPERRPSIEEIVNDSWFGALSHCSCSKACGTDHVIRPKSV